MQVTTIRSIRFGPIKLERPAEFNAVLDVEQVDEW